MHRRASRNSTITNCVGIDDGPFLSRRLGASTAPLVGAQLNAPHLVKARVGRISVDGLDATTTALRMLSSLPSRHSSILLACATLAGLSMLSPSVLLKRSGTQTGVFVG